MNIYQKQYEDLVYNRQHIEILSESKGTEVHHIKMKSLYLELEKEESNLVRLTTFEHILAHKYLALWYAEEYGTNDSRYYSAFLAYSIMTTSHNVTVSIEEAAKLRTENKRIISQISKNLWKDPSFRQKQSISLRLANKDPKVKKNRSKAAKKRMTKLWKSNEYRKTRKDRITGTTRIFNVATKHFKLLKQSEIQQYLDNGWTLGTPIYNIPVSGKYKGQLLTVYICPWKINTCKRLQPRMPGRKPVWSLVKP